VVITALENDLSHMREEYGQMVRGAFRRKMLTNPLVFIFSAESLNQAFRRWLFLRKYDRLRKEQSRAIAETQEMLRRKMSGLASVKKEKEELLVSLQGQQSTLSSELAQKDQLLKTLAQDESRLKKELLEKQKTHEALNQAIERIIQEEVQRRLEESRKPRTNTAPKPSAAKPSASKPSASSNPADSRKEPEKPAAAPEEAAKVDAISNNFVRQRGRLPWPVENGIITRPFGRQKHPTIKSVEITNNGIDIRTENGSSVKSVFEGQVAGVQFIPGHDYTVIIQHGDYYTVYSNLSETFVNKGDKVSARQSIGQVSTNPITGSSELHFELWQEKERMNPAIWIKK
jgi:septal ring factor EnvC (AmiA/AmiB activator)